MNNKMETKEALFDASTTIYNQIATLRRGMPIAEAKARTQREKLQVRRRYLTQIQVLDTQYKAVWTAMQEVSA